MIDWKRLLRRRQAGDKAPVYEDPLAVYGRLAGEKTPRPAETPRTRSMWGRLFRTGHDTGFVFHDE